MKWSEYQSAIFDAVASANGDDLIVRARAGAAKTTTAIESLVYVPEKESVMLVAFNKAIEQQLAQKAPEGVEVRTLHAYGLRAVSKTVGSIKVDGNRTRALCRSMYDGHLTRETTTGLVHAVSACKNLLAETPKEIEDVIYRMEIDTGIVFPGDKMASTSTPNMISWLDNEYLKFIKRVGELLSASRNVDQVIDFDDMVWLPHARDMSLYTYDHIFVDEAQDTNPVQVALVERGLGRAGRLVAIGDERQAIYGWRGADVSVMQNESAEHLDLPICYRCAKSVVRVAKNVVPDIQEWSEAPEGEVLWGDWETIVEMSEEGDFILSRTNAPLMGLWLALLAAGKPARILGRGAGSTIMSFIKRSKADTVSQLLLYTQKWLELEVSRLSDMMLNTASKYDMAECIEYLSRGVDTIEAMIKRADEMFTQNTNKPRIMLSTVHRAKGLESHRVFVLMKTFCWRPGIEEQNIFYVAVTRAKQSLVLIGDREDLERSYRAVQRH